jgi:hypothetical protein
MVRYAAWTVFDAISNQSIKPSLVVTRDGNHSELAPELCSPNRPIRSASLRCVVLETNFQGELDMLAKLCNPRGRCIYVMLCYAFLCCVVLCCVVLCYVVLCCVVLCCVVLCCRIINFDWVLR